MKRNLFPTSPRNEDLVARTRAFDEAFATYSVPLLRYFTRKTRDPHIAEDLLQELWLRVDQSFSTQQMAHLALLRRKAKQVFIDYQRRRKVRGFVTFTDRLPESEETPTYREDGTPETEKALRESFWSQFPNIEELTPAQRETFWLKARYGYSLEEISKMTQTPVSTVHDWVQRVKTVCASRFNQEDKS